MRIAGIVDNEVFYVFETQFIWNGNALQEALLNNPTIIDTTGLEDVLTGSIYENGKFYKNTDLERQNPHKEIPLEEQKWRKITFVYNGSVVLSLTPDPSFPLSELIYAGFMSNPIFVNASEVDDLDYGWTWDGQFFNPPMNG